MESTLLGFLNTNGSTVAMSAVQGPLVDSEVAECKEFRYGIQRFICAHCLCVAEEVPMGVPVSMRMLPGGKLELVVRDRVAVKCLTRYMHDQSAAAASNSSHENVTDLRSAMLTEVYGCRDNLAVCMPFAPSRIDLPTFRTDVSDTVRTQFMQHSVAWHKDHSLHVLPPHPSTVNIYVEKRTICIDRHIRPHAPFVTTGLRTLLPHFITTSLTPPPASQQSSSMSIAAPASVSDAKSKTMPSITSHKLDAFLPHVVVMHTTTTTSTPSVSSSTTTPATHRARPYTASGAIAVRGPSSIQIADDDIGP